MGTISKWSEPETETSYQLLLKDFYQITLCQYKTNYYSGTTLNTIKGTSANKAILKINPKKRRGDIHIYAQNFLHRSPSAYHMCYFRYCMHAHSHTIKHLQLRTPNCQITRTPALHYLTQSLHNNKKYNTPNTGTISLYGSHDKMTGQCLFAVENGAAFTLKKFLSESVAESNLPLQHLCIQAGTC